MVQSAGIKTYPGDARRVECEAYFFWGRLEKIPPGALLSLSAKMKFIPREGEVALRGKFSNLADNPFHSPG